MDNTYLDSYKLPCEGDVKDAMRLFISKVEYARDKNLKVSKASLDAVEVFRQLLRADHHPYGGWVLYRP